MPTPPQIFDRIAHSSIMRLSESSMEKLYDLMTMGFKYQLVCCSHPGELLTITMNHLQVRFPHPPPNHPTPPPSRPSQALAAAPTNDKHASPAALLDTLRPSQTLRQMVISPDVVALLESAQQYTRSTLGLLDAADFVLLRQTLCSFFQDKVSAGAPNVLARPPMKRVASCLHIARSVACGL
jgi:hypothetical protein